MSRLKYKNPVTGLIEYVGSGDHVHVGTRKTWGEATVTDASTPLSGQGTIALTAGMLYRVKVRVKIIHYSVPTADGIMHYQLTIPFTGTPDTSKAFRQYDSSVIGSITIPRSTTQPANQVDYLDFEEYVVGASGCALNVAGATVAYSNGGSYASLQASGAVLVETIGAV